MKLHSIVLIAVSLSPLAAQGPGPGTETYTFTTIRKFPTTNQTAEIETYLTRIVARLNGGNPVYDQALPAALADSTVQSAIAQARAALNGAGAPAAVTITGPTQLSSSRTLQSTSTQTVDGTPTQEQVTTVTPGPATIFVGDDAAISFFVRAGDTNYDLKTTITTPRTVTTTNTYQTSQTYLLSGTTTANPPAVPLPPSLILGLTGVAGAGLYELRRRLSL